jgi:hypothetical protein
MRHLVAAAWWAGSTATRDCAGRTFVWLQRSHAYTLFTCARKGHRSAAPGAEDRLDVLPNANVVWVNRSVRDLAPAA